MYSVKVNNIGKVYSSSSYEEAYAIFEETKRASKNDVESPYFGRNVHFFEGSVMKFKKGGSIQDKPKSQLNSAFKNKDLVEHGNSYYRVISVQTPLTKFNKEFVYSLENVHNGNVIRLVKEEQIKNIADALEVEVRKAKTDEDRMMKISDLAYAKLNSLNSQEILLNEKRQEQYLQIIEDEAKKWGITKESALDDEIIRDANYHLLNQALTILGFYGVRAYKDYEKTYEWEDIQPYNINPYLKQIRNKKIKNIESRSRKIARYIDQLISVNADPIAIRKLEAKLTLNNKLLEKTRVKYSNGGKLSNEFKFDRNFIVYVPSTTDVGVKIAPVELDKRVDEVKEYFANLFGGFTETDADGGYKSHSGEIVEEEVVKVSVFSKNKNWKENESQVVQKVKDWAKEWGQESIGFEYEGDLYYIDQDTDGVHKEEPIEDPTDSPAENMQLPSTAENRRPFETEEIIWGENHPAQLVSYGIGGRVIFNK
jgi:hypothetical protein